MNKKVYLITSEESFYNNYGALLQGYALNQILNDLGYDTYVIRYKGDGDIKRNSILKNPITRFLKRIVFSLFHKKDIFLKSYKKDIDNRLKKIICFQTANMKFANTKQWSYRTLKRKRPMAYAYVCGSDQIWNPCFNGNDRGYFLTFVPDGIKKIAYAPSLGVNEIPKKDISVIKNYIQTFDSLSVREQNGVELLKDLTAKQIHWVLDPTLVLDRERWANLASDIRNKPYILVYHFSGENQLKDSVLNLSRKYNLDVISIPMNKVACEDGFNFYFAGIEEFLGLIKNAKLVCTDSFHATVFSIIMNTPFLVFMREQIASGVDMNSRIDSLLKMTNLTNRIVINSQNIENIDIFDCDYKQAYANIDKFKAASYDYLKSVLEADRE